MQEEERQPLSPSQLLRERQKAQTDPEALQRSGLQPARVSGLGGRQRSLLAEKTELACINHLLC